MRIFLTVIIVAIVIHFIRCQMTFTDNWDKRSINTELLQKWQSAKQPRTITPSRGFCTRVFLAEMTAELNELLRRRSELLRLVEKCSK
ncbi:hypothetical protein AB6A40_003779 [Gnathostoma spinigerum]|uniref:Uncharacterized protein n=1 Tax=Gnathostoma spinigerum TaxID=75299 RepID=A0ABD6ELC2_9BILA